MVEDDKRIRIITGHYGSGKTEFALNYSIKLSETSKKIAIADLDIVNVYFRSREKKKFLEDKGIKVISSCITSDSSDLPALSGEISVPIIDKSYDYVIDLGGNDVGAVTLSSLKPFFNKEEIDFFMVVNTNRPDTESVEKIIDEMKKLENSTGLKVTGFVNNSNLIRETTCETIKIGEEILKKVSEITKVDIRYTSYIKEIVKDIKVEFLGEELPMDFYMRKLWM